MGMSNIVGTCNRYQKDANTLAQPGTDTTPGEELTDPTHIYLNDEY